MKSPSRLGIVLSCLTALALGCASTPGANPDDMSAADHRDHAARSRAGADAHAAQYDPDASEERAVQGYGFWEVTEYNPSVRHLNHANEKREHAADHLAAAKALESFEQAQCAAFPAATRKVCPLEGGVVASVEDTDGGVILRLADGVNAKAALAHVNCHLAFARAQARKGMDECPLYLPGVSAKAADGPLGISLTIENADRVGDLRKRAVSHTAP